MKVLLAMILILSASTAYAERIRDMSLTPSESMKQPDISNSGSQPLGGSWSNNFGQNNEGTGHIQNPISGTGYGQLTHRYFMESYCNQDIRPIVRSPRLGEMTACLDDIKSKACDSFLRLPPEAQSSVDGAVECMFSAMEDAGSEYVSTRACARSEQDQLALVKKYWGSPEVAYAILFIPDMVTNPMVFCSRR